MKHFQHTIILFFLSISAFAQSYNLHNSQLFSHYDRYLYARTDSFHTAVRPFQMQQVNQFVAIDSLYKIETDAKWKDILLNRSLIQYRSEHFNFNINPLFDFSAGSEVQESENTYTNSRGIQVDGTVGEKLAFYTSFTENQRSFYGYQTALVDSLHVVPGQGYTKPFKENAYDYAYAEAYASYSPNPWINLQLGHGKNFIGDGYRSLLMSDNAFNYPFLKLTADVWKLKYMALWAQFQEPNMSHAYIQGNPKQWMSAHYLDWNVCKWFSIGFFEAIVWADTDSLGNKRGFDFSYADPLIFNRPVEFANGSPDNVFMGLNGKITPAPWMVLYGQLVIDEFKLEHVKAQDGWWANKFGALGGMKLFDLFGVNHLDLQGECSAVRPFTYSHFDNLQNYGHYAQPMAHPLGANFAEALAIAKYNYKRVFFQLKTTYNLQGTDSSAYSMGGNIYRPYTARDQSRELGNDFLQGEKQTVMTTGVALSYLVNPATNMNITLGADIRTAERAGEKQNSAFIYFAFRTALGNQYFDY